MTEKGDDSMDGMLVMPWFFLEGVPDSCMISHIYVYIYIYIYIHIYIYMCAYLKLL